MITYEPFWNTLKHSSETTYTLIHKHNINSTTITRLRNNEPVTTRTLNDLCRILKCELHEIVIYIDEEAENENK
ncbi:MAG: helix-turn-helix transcriptional regulator [Eubacterium sp.]|nr:helix-turn-helix transcriptional regulator [Eubacterium sp.]